MTNGMPANGIQQMMGGWASPMQQSGMIGQPGTMQTPNGMMAMGQPGTMQQQTIPLTVPAGAASGQQAATTDNGADKHKEEAEGEGEAEEDEAAAF